MNLLPSLGDNDNVVVGMVRKEGEEGESVDGASGPVSRLSLIALKFWVQHRRENWIFGTSNNVLHTFAISNIDFIRGKRAEISKMVLKPKVTYF